MRRGTKVEISWVIGTPLKRGDTHISRRFTARSGDRYRGTDFLEGNITQPGLS